MARSKHHGFTIIEVLLFLAVTGVLVVTVLLGMSLSLNRQRYRESVESLKQLAQDQYSEVSNVVNSNPKNPVCTLEDGKLQLASGNSTSSRGTAECLILGRLLVLNKQEAQIYSIIGLANNSAASQTDDLAMLSNYSYLSKEVEKNPYSWDASVVPKIVKADVSSASSAKVLIVRSPLSGSILTFISHGDDSVTGGSIQSMVTSDANNTGLLMCVDFGLNFTMPKQAVKLNPNGSSASAVEIPIVVQGMC